MNNYKVSIIVPIYNVEKYIEKCAISLFEQDFNDIEYIFVNDCTPDNSIDVLQKVIQNYPLRTPHCKIIHHKENKGSGTARKTGIQAATGKYTIQIDSDDWCELNMISKLYNKAQEDSSDIVYCNFFINHKDKEVPNKIIIKSPENNIFDILQFNWDFPPSLANKLIKRSLYVNNNIYPQVNISIAEDRWFILRLMCFAQNISYISECLYHYWQGNKYSLMTNLKENNKLLQDLKYYTETTQDFLVKNGLKTTYLKKHYQGSLGFLISTTKIGDFNKNVNFVCSDMNRLNVLFGVKTIRTDLKVIHSLYMLKLGIIATSLLILRKKIKNFYRRLIKDKFNKG